MNRFCFGSVFPSLSQGVRRYGRGYVFAGVSLLFGEAKGKEGLGIRAFQTALLSATLRTINS